MDPKLNQEPHVEESFHSGSFGLFYALLDKRGYYWLLYADQCWWERSRLHFKDKHAMIIVVTGTMLSTLDEDPFNHDTNTIKSKSLEELDMMSLKIL